MKEYEIYSNLKIPIGSNIIVRLDGRAFHKLTRDLNLEKPYDVNFSRLMVDVSSDLASEFSPSFIYTFSDEISILLDEIPFNGRVEKINSTLASFAASSFQMHLNSYFKPLKRPVSFDSRVIPLNDSDVGKYFKWRQDEAWRNCVNGYGIWILREKYSPKVANEKIHGLKNSDIHELLFKEGINLNNVDTWKKRGIAIYKTLNEKNNKKTFTTDFNIPIFNDSFFKDNSII